jgi:multidrug efflux pump subunit AcrB
MESLEKGIIPKFIKNPVFGNILMVLFIVTGLVGVKMMIRESFPQFDLDFVNITVAYPGADPAEVEESISRPIEDALEGVSGVQRVFTIAREGVGMGVVEVNPKADADRVQREVKNKIDTINTFPASAEKPIISGFRFDDPVVNIAVWGELPERQLKELARELRTDLLTLPGISRVNLTGIRDYQVSIEVSEARLRQYGLTFSEITAAIRGSSNNFPGGTLRTDEEDFTIRVIGRRYFAREFGDIVLRANQTGSQITLGDVAELVESFDTDSTIHGLFNGKPSVNLAVLKARTEDAITIAERVEGFIAKRRASVPSTVHLSTWLDSSRLVRDRIDLLLKNGLYGLILVFFSLWMFLELRLSFWVTVGIAVSLFGALAIMAVSGQSINLISLFALIMVLGIIVDDAIVVGEAIYVRRENGESAHAAAIGGVREVIWPVTTAILTSILAFTPLLFVSGIMGKFIRVMPGPVIAALFISLFEALIILPVHLRHLPVPHSGKRSPFNIMGRVRDVVNYITDSFVSFIYCPFVDFCIRWRYATLASGVAIILLTIGQVTGGKIKLIMFPEADSDYIHVRLELPGGTPITQTEAAARQVDAAWRATEEHYREQLGGRPLSVAVYANVGGTLALGDEPEVGDNIANIFVELLPTEDRNIHFRDILDVWRAKTGIVPDAIALQFLGFEGGPPGGNIQIDLTGAEEGQLVDAVNALKAQLATYDGVIEIGSDYKPGKQEIRIRRKPAAEALGITLAEIGKQMRAGFYGEEVARVQRGADEVKIMLRYPEDERRSLAQIRHLRIRGRNGAEVPLETVADIEMGPGFAKIRRENGRRKFSVTAETVRGANSEEVMRDLIGNYLPQLTAEYGVRAERGFESADRISSMISIAVGAGVAMLLIYLTMATIFHSYLQPAIIMFAIPFGLVGAIVGHRVYGTPMSMMTFFGMTALTGVVVNDAIVLIVAINERLAKGMPIFEAFREGGKRRFRAIVLTSLTTFAGLFPMLLEKSFQAQVLIPMALSIAFGVLFATIGTLLIIPCLLAVLNDVRCLHYAIWHLRWPESRESVEPSCNIGKL